MAKDADAHATEDKEKREEIDARNSLDSMVYNIDKMLKDSGDKMQGEEAAPVKAEVESVLADSKKLLEGTPTSKELKDQNDKLVLASHKLAEILYKANAASAASGAAPASEPGTEPHAEQKKDGGVIDAEYVDVDEKK
jgi:molecular chaperone DnaK